MTLQELKSIEKAFDVPLSEMKRIIRAFHSEMGKGLSDSDGSLKMIPTYVDRPTGDEKGKFIALDLGGTNFRILEMELKGGKNISKPVSRQFVLDRKYLAGDGKALFDFIAGCVEIFLKGKGIDKAAHFDLGFTFSFPVEQTGIASGRLLRWTKGFNAKGVIGKDVVRLLDEALAGKHVNNVKVAALANDTVGTMVARAYEDPDCDVGVILGTGTNACYREYISNIKKLHSGMTYAGQMIVNTEWGNFNKLRTNSYDKILDEGSGNRGSQILEKMVSGMYLGEIFRLIAKDLMKKKVLFAGTNIGVFGKRGCFKTEYMSAIESDHSAGLPDMARLFKKLGIKDTTLRDRQLCRNICRIVSGRASRISAAALAAVIMKMDRELSRKHTIAIDGSVFEKYPGFSDRMRSALKEIFGNRSSRVSMVLAKDGSGKGAAIIAAVAGSL